MRSEDRTKRVQEIEREKEEEGTSKIYYVSCNVQDSGCQGKRCCLFCFFSFWSKSGALRHPHIWGFCRASTSALQLHWISFPIELVAGTQFCTIWEYFNQTHKKRLTMQITVANRAQYSQRKILVFCLWNVFCGLGHFQHYGSSFFIMYKSECQQTGSFEARKKTRLLMACRHLQE